MGTPTGLLFKQIHDKLEKQANNTLRQQGLTMMQVSVLLTIQGAEGKRCSMKELERFFGRGPVHGGGGRLSAGAEGPGDRHRCPGGQACKVGLHYRIWREMLRPGGLSHGPGRGEAAAGLLPGGAGAAERHAGPGGRQSELKISLLPEGYFRDKTIACY